LELRLSEGFKALARGLRWRKVDDYIGEEAQVVEEDVRRMARLREAMRRRAESLPGFRERLFRVSREGVEWGWEVLHGGDVAGVDGTLAMYPTPVGYKCRIGVVAVNYVGDRVEEAVYVSDAHMVDEEAGKIEELLGEMERVSRVSSLLYRALMLYKERELALERREDWRLVHGPLVPLEMRLSRLGVTDSLQTCLELAGRIVEDGGVIGVLSSTSRLRLLNLGYLLKPGEYLFIGSAGDLMRREKRGLAPWEEELVDEFIRGYGDRISVGIFRAGPRAYVFEAREDVFHEAARIVMADSLHNRVRGFPALLDYADSVCRSLLSPEEFRVRVEQKLLEVEGDEGIYAFDERRLRW